MTDNERLLRIKEQCDKRGWIAFIAGDENGENHQLQVKVPVDVAEALLAATDLGAPVVVIANDKYDSIEYRHPIMCSFDCTFHPGGSGPCQWDNKHHTHYIPGPDCPGPAEEGYEWVLVKRLVRVDGGGE